MLTSVDRMHDKFPSNPFSQVLTENDATKLVEDGRRRLAVHLDAARFH